MARGIHASRDLVDIFREESFPTRRHMIKGYDAHVFYGLEGHLPKLFAAAMEESTAVYVDLGYWNRREGGRYLGYHKVVVNARHPTGYFQRPVHDGLRFRKLGVGIRNWRSRTSSGAILVAGMGAKGAAAEGYGPQEWERATIRELQAVTDREIVYRPKPSDPLGSPIQGTTYSPKARPLEDDLATAWAVVTHHSNVAIDALIAGVPVFCAGGAAHALVGAQDLAEIEYPHMPDGREQWASDLAYTQWTVAEMASGACWQHLKSEGLV